MHSVEHKSSGSAIWSSRDVTREWTWVLHTAVVRRVCIFAIRNRRSILGPTCQVGCQVERLCLEQLATVIWISQIHRWRATEKASGRRRNEKGLLRSASASFRNRWLSSSHRLISFTHSSIFRCDLMTTTSCKQFLEA